MPSISKKPPAMTSASASRSAASSTTLPRRKMPASGQQKQQKQQYHQQRRLRWWWRRATKNSPGIICLATAVGIVALLKVQQSLRLLFDPVARSVRRRRNENPKPYRIFGPYSSSSNDGSYEELGGDASEFSFEWHTRAQQRQFLADFGGFCQRGFVAGSHRGGQQHQRNDDDDGSNLLVRQFDRLPESYGLELWKYCVLYTGIGNVYWEGNGNLKPLVMWDDLLGGPTKGTSIAIQLERAASATYAGGSYGMVDDESDPVDPLSGDGEGSEYYTAGPAQLSHSFLHVARPKSKVCSNMMRILTELPSLVDPVRLSELLGLYVANDRQEWQHWTAKCLWVGQQPEMSSYSSTMTGTGRDAPTTPILLQPSPSSSAQVAPSDARRELPVRWQQQRCPMANGGHCCQVWLPEAPDTRWASLVLRDPYLTVSPQPKNGAERTGASGEDKSRHRPYVDTLDEKQLGMAASEIPYIATIREVPTPKPNTGAVAKPLDTPNFFDILVENNCLPEGRECFRCLKRTAKTTGTEKQEDHHSLSEVNDCVRCQKECPCYCRTLCHVRPPPKRLAAEWLVRLPPLKHDPSRLIPRLIHQTWYEPITPEKYPNMSRLIESFRRQSGWQYNFYDDDQAAEFLSAHFPPQVREAYDAILPGAFKADLFRYCVLLIRGGVYADMDIMLQSNLDYVLGDSIGFVTALDSPGAPKHRSCLWNGFMASAPGHPFLMRTIENVVNNIRNRFTSVDYDDMLCPDPVLSVSHTSDMLFTCGPCILGASINDVLRRHKQTSFEYGDIDLFETEKRREQQAEAGVGLGVTPVGDGGAFASTAMIDPDDPRLLISGRSILLKQNKEDMGAHRFTWVEANAVVASTDLPDYDDRPKSLVHYSKAREKFGIYGYTKLYNDTDAGTQQHRANEEIRIRIE